MYKKILKRFIDVILALLAIFCLSPLLIIVVILVRIRLGKPIIFKQERPGLNEEIFTIYKFRTMTNEKDKNGLLLPDTDRLTKFGKILRNTSIDELPELFNILVGNMSIVGPRPQLVKDMLFMTSEQKKRHSVKPGLTGLAQVNGRNNISWEDKFRYDLEYIRDITFIKDLKIILLTVIKVFTSQGVSTNGMDTAEDLGDYLLRVGKIDIDTYKRTISKLEQ